MSQRLYELMDLICKGSKLWILETLNVLSVVLNVLESKKNSGIVLKWQYHTARSKSSENCHSVFEDNNNFIGLYERSWNKHLIKLITFRKNLLTT